MADRDAPGKERVEQSTQQPALDGIGKRDIQNHLKGLKKAIEKAKQDKCEALVKRLEAEKKKVEGHLKKATGLQGKDRDINNPYNKLRPRIHNALARAYKTLKNAEPPMIRLANHFEVNISSMDSTAFIYQPDPPLPWSFDPQKTGDTEKLRET